MEDSYLDSSWEDRWELPEAGDDQYGHDQDEDFDPDELYTDPYDYYDY